LGLPKTNRHTSTAIQTEFYWRVYQVVKEIAKDTLNRPISTKRKTQISWLTHKNIKRKASVRRLEIKKQMINNGEIDVYKAIAPLEYQIAKVQSNGTFIC